MDQEGSLIFAKKKNYKMAITLYGTMTSGPCRMVSMTLEFVGKKYDYKNVDLMKGEHKTPEYMKVSKYFFNVGTHVHLTYIC